MRAFPTLLPSLSLSRRKTNKKDGNWSLFCPNEAPGLPDVFGDEFEALYESYEAKGLARKSIKARQLWVAIMDAQVDSRNPRAPRSPLPRPLPVPRLSLCFLIVRFSPAVGFLCCILYPAPPPPPR